MNRVFLKKILKRFLFGIILIPIIVFGYIGCSAVVTEYDLNELYQQITWLSFSFVKHLNGDDESSSGILDKSVRQDIHEAYYKAGVKRPKCFRNVRNVFDGEINIIFAHGYQNSQNNYYKIVATKIPYKACVRFLTRPWPRKMGLIYALDGNLYETPVERQKAVEVCGIHRASGLTEINLYEKMPAKYTASMLDISEAGIYVFQPVACPCSSTTEFDVIPYQKGSDNIFGQERGFINSVEKK